MTTRKHIIAGGNFGWKAMDKHSQMIASPVSARASDILDSFNVDSVVKSPISALRFILRHCDVR